MSLRHNFFARRGFTSLTLCHSCLIPPTSGLMVRCGTGLLLWEFVGSRRFGGSPGGSARRPTMLARHPEDGGGPRGEAGERRDRDPADDPTRRVMGLESHDVAPEDVDMTVGLPPIRCRSR